ncbi:hypothetical protein DPMN_056005 [Dreissena polymorpha]|uniref:Uncharacterized protein n=1 Tax=Dreissena polymorpha TaxID=45954 RepID=A0A9D4CSU2_DREPO|nr:hypothetical protein DPMN_056005 [Dreissena polymorpha]
MSRLSNTLDIDIALDDSDVSMPWRRRYPRFEARRLNRRHNDEWCTVAVSIVGGESINPELIDPSFDTKTPKQHSHCWRDRGASLYNGKREMICLALRVGMGVPRIRKEKGRRKRKKRISIDESRYINDSRIIVGRPNIRYWNNIIIEYNYYYFYNCCCFCCCCYNYNYYNYYYYYYYFNYYYYYYYYNYYYS